MKSMGIKRFVKDDALTIYIHAFTGGHATLHYVNHKGEEQKREELEGSAISEKTTYIRLKGWKWTHLLDHGQVVATPGALSLVNQFGANYMKLLQRHIAGDWGDLGNEDKKANDQAVISKGRILSSYDLDDDGAKVWIITEWDRSVTTLLLPSEY